MKIDIFKVWFFGLIWPIAVEIFKYNFSISYINFLLHPHLILLQTLIN